MCAYTRSLRQFYRICSAIREGDKETFEELYETFMEEAEEDYTLFIACDLICLYSGDELISSHPCPWIIK